MGRGGFYGNDDQLDQYEKLASASLGSVLAPKAQHIHSSASLGSVLAPKAQHIHSSLGQRPRIHRPKKTPALKVRFSSGTSSDAPQIEARLQRLDGDLNLNPWGEAPG